MKKLLIALSIAASLFVFADKSNIDDPDRWQLIDLDIELPPKTYVSLKPYCENNYQMFEAYLVNIETKTYRIQKIQAFEEDLYKKLPIRRALCSYRGN